VVPRGEDQLRGTNGREVVGSMREEGGKFALRNCDGSKYFEPELIGNRGRIRSAGTYRKTHKANLRGGGRRTERLLQGEKRGGDKGSVLHS